MTIEMKQLGGETKPRDKNIKTIFGDVKVVGMAKNLFGGWSIFLAKDPKDKSKGNPKDKPKNKQPIKPFDLPF